MAYSPFAESFSSAVETKESRFHLVYSDIADATPTDRPFRRRSLRSLPTLAGFARRTRSEILGVVLRDMLLLPASADGLRRVGHGRYQWRFADEGCS